MHSVDVYLVAQSVGEERCQSMHQADVSHRRAHLKGWGTCGLQMQLGRCEPLLLLPQVRAWVEAKVRPLLPLALDLSAHPLPCMCGRRRGTPAWPSHTQRRHRRCQLWEDTGAGAPRTSAQGDNTRLQGTQGFAHQVHNSFGWPPFRHAAPPRCVAMTGAPLT